MCKVVGWKSRAMLDRYGIVDERAAARVGEKAEAYLKQFQGGDETEAVN